MRVLKYLYYGDSEFLDFRVKVFVVCVNEGCKYLLEVDGLFFVYWLCFFFVVGYLYFYWVILFWNFKIMLEFCIYWYLYLWFLLIF